MPVKLDLITINAYYGNSRKWRKCIRILNNLFDIVENVWQTDVSRTLINSSDTANQNTKRGMKVGVNYVEIEVPMVFIKE